MINAVNGIRISPIGAKESRCLVVELLDCRLPGDSVRGLLLEARRLAGKLIIVAPSCGLGDLYAILRELANNNMDFPVRAYTAGVDFAEREGCSEVIKRVVPYGGGEDRGSPVQG